MKLQIDRMEKTKRKRCEQYSLIDKKKKEETKSQERRITTRKSNPTTDMKNSDAYSMLYADGSNPIPQHKRVVNNDIKIKNFSSIINENKEKPSKEPNSPYKAIISLTSWRARINTVGKTLYSLVKMCPGFHIVLVLSEEEFPKKEQELPEELMLFVKNDLVEILWVYKNYKAFKKVLFTMDKYRDVPVISADDDCIYLKNYAQEFYDVWKNNKDCFVSCWGKKYKNVNIKDVYVWHTAGAATLFPPYVFGENGIKCLSDELLKITNQDDNFYTCLKLNMELKKTIIVGTHRGTYRFHDEINPLHKEYRVMTEKDKDELNEKIYKLILQCL